MASYHKRSRRHPVLTVVLCLLVLCIVAAGAAYGMLNSKFKRLQQGATFDFSYNVECTSAEAPALYTVLDRFSTTQGDIYGLYEPNKLLLSFYQVADGSSSAVYDTQNKTITLQPEAKASDPFTRIYISDSETLYDVGQLYSTIRQAIVSQYSLADVLLPQWTLGNYISQTQLAALLGVELGTVEMQDMTGFKPLALAALQAAEPENALDGFRYFQLASSSEGADAPTLIFGLPMKDVFSKTTPLHILLTIPKHSVKVELLGTLTPAAATVIEPTSRMKDEDISTFAQIRQAVEELLNWAQQ